MTGQGPAWWPRAKNYITDRPTRTEIEQWQQSTKKLPHRLLMIPPTVIAYVRSKESERAEDILDQIQNVIVVTARSKWILRLEKAATTRRVQVPVQNKMTKRARQINEIVKAMRKEGQKTLHAYFK